MKEELSSKEVIRDIWNGFDVYLKCKVDWVSNYGKMGEKHIFWEIFGDMYWYTLNLYRYTLGSGHLWPRCTGTC